MGVFLLHSDTSSHFRLGTRAFVCRPGPGTICSHCTCHGYGRGTNHFHAFLHAHLCRFLLVIITHFSALILYLSSPLGRRNALDHMPVRRHQHGARLVQSCCVDLFLKIHNSSWNLIENVYGNWQYHIFCCENASKYSCKTYVVRTSICAQSLFRTKLDLLYFVWI